MSDFDLDSWLVGYVYGLTGKIMCNTKKDPVAFLYNGVKLPKLPEWDKTKYPYAYISLGFGEYILVLSTVRMIIEMDGGLTVPATAGTVTLLLHKNITITDYWGESKEREIYYGAIDIVDPFWCNEDLFYEDGTLFIAASDPVPVYE